MSRSKKQAREALLRDMAAIAALFEEAGVATPLPAEKLMAAMATASEGEQRGRLRTFCCEGWIDAATNSTEWLRGRGSFVLGCVRLWQIELADIDDAASDRRRP